MLRWLPVAALVVTTLLALPSARGKPFGSVAATPADALVEEGSAKLQGGDVEGALAAFERAQKAAPRDPRPLFLRGAALVKKKDSEGAIKAYRAALALDGKLAAVRNELGAALREARRTDEAMLEWREAVKLDPELGEAWYNLGQAEMASGRAAAAVEDYRKAAALSPKDADVRIELSVALRKAGKRDKATAAAREAVALAVTGAASAPAHLNLALALQSAGKLDDAAAEATAATRFDPAYSTAWWTLGVVERERKKLDASVAALEKALKLKPAPAVAADLAATYEAKNEPAKAEALLRSAIEKSPRSLALRVALVRALASQKKCTEARAALAPLPPDGQRAAAEAVETSCAKQPAPASKKAASPAR